MGAREELRKINQKLIDITPQIPIEFFIKPDGNDSADGKSLDSAFRTPEHAIDVINDLNILERNINIWLAPGNYYVLNGKYLYKDYFKFEAILGTPGKTNWIGSGTSGSLSPSSQNALNIEGRFNTFKGITFFTNSPNWASLGFFAKSGGGGYGGRNIVDSCYFFLGTSSAQCKNNIVFSGTKRNIIKNCIFQGANTAAIRILFNFENIEDNIIEDNIFIGTNRGIIIESDNYNTIIRKNLFSIGSKTDEAMVNAIEITSGMSAGKIIVSGNEFEQSAANDILDNKVGGTLIEMNNFNGA